MKTGGSLFSHNPASSSTVTQLQQPHENWVRCQTTLTFSMIRQWITFTEKIKR